MNSKIKKSLIIVGCALVSLLILHLTMNNLIPFIKHMHSGGAY